MLFALVFGLFFWYLSRAFRYTNETVGKDSPVHRERTYQFTALQYFSDFLRIANPIMVVMMLSLAFITGKAAVRQEEPLLFIFSPIFLGFGGLFCFAIYFDWQYWTITRNVLLTFNPFKKSITVDGPARYNILTPENVVRIEQHTKKTSNSKDLLGGYGYYLFHTTDGQIMQINNIFFSHIGHFEFLKHFFPNTPITVVEHRLPWVTDLSQTKNTKSPNFAAWHPR